MGEHASVAGLAASKAGVSPARIFWAAWLGWMLDGFDATVYIYVLSAAVTELLTHDGRVASTANVALFGGYFFSIFMLGWAGSMVWGRLADRIGRVRVMCLTILTYSVFTGLCGLSPNLLLFGIFRFLAGFGIGGEWTAGVTLLHESLPETLRVRYAGWLHTATPAGITLAAAASFLFPWLGWRGMFILGALPALLIVYLRRKSPNPRSGASARRTSCLGFSRLIRRPSARSGGCRSLGRVRDLRVVIHQLLGSTFGITRVVANGGNRRRGATMASFAGLYRKFRTMARVPDLAVAGARVWIATKTGAFLHGIALRRSSRVRVRRRDPAAGFKTVSDAPSAGRLLTMASSRSTRLASGNVPGRKHRASGRDLPLVLGACWVALDRQSSDAGGIGRFIPNRDRRSLLHLPSSDCRSTSWRLKRPIAPFPNSDVRKHPLPHVRRKARMCSATSAGALRLARCPCPWSSTSRTSGRVLAKASEVSFSGCGAL